MPLQDKHLWLNLGQAIFNLAKFLAIFNLAKFFKIKALQCTIRGGGVSNPQLFLKYCVTVL